MPRVQQSPIMPREVGSERYRQFLQEVLGNHARALYLAQETVYLITVGDETTNLSAGIGKTTFRFPWTFNVSEIRASVNTAQASGLILTVDVNINGTSMLSTALTIDNTERTSYTAATPAVISSPTIALDDEITVDIDQIGAVGARGLKIMLIGYRI